MSLGGNRRIYTVADARRLAAPVLEIAPGDAVTPIHDHQQASHTRQSVVGLRVGARYTVAGVEGGFSGAFVTVAEQPGEKFPAHLFARAE